MRVNPQRPAVALDCASRLLVVADEHCASPALWQEIYGRLAGAVAVHLVVPVRVSHVHYLTNDELGHPLGSAMVGVVLLQNGLQSVGEGVGEAASQAEFRSRQRRDRTEEVAGS